MASKKKYYAVKNGREQGIFETWEACSKAVTGYPQAEYKGFLTREEAIFYLKNIPGEGQEGTVLGTSGQKFKITGDILPEKDCLLAYVDGSYQDSIKKYAFGCVFILHDGRIFTEYGNGDNPQSLEQRNVTGEMLGAMYAVRTAIKNHFREIEIRYDYQGIESWVTGAWKSKNELTQKYAMSMREWGKSIRIHFTKVAAHTNERFNELADQMAKKGLTEGCGIPAIRLLDELDEWHPEEA